MFIFPIEGSFEVDETMEMISAILMTLSSNDVLCTKQRHKIDKVLIWPVRSGLREGEQEVTTDEAGVIFAQAFSRRAVAWVFIKPDMSRSGERVVILVGRIDLSVASGSPTS